MLAFENSMEDHKIPQYSNEETVSFTYTNIGNKFSPLKRAKRQTIKREDQHNLNATNDSGDDGRLCV